MKLKKLSCGNSQKNVSTHCENKNAWTDAKSTEHGLSYHVLITLFPCTTETFRYTKQRYLKLAKVCLKFCNTILSDVKGMI